MIRTDIPHSDIVNDEDFQASNEEHPYEHISCPSHPDYKLQLLCTKENFSPLLLCIKCLIDTETQRSVSGEDLVYIHDAITKGLSLDVSDSQIQAAKAKLEHKFLEFSSVDYLGVYEQHSNAQISKLDREITRIKESLDELQIQFKQLFSKQYRYLKNKQEELTTKIKDFIEEQEQVDTLRSLNSEEITDVIRKLTNAKEYEKLVKALFDRGSLNEGVVNGTTLKEVFGIIDDLKNKVHNLKNFKIEMSKLEDVRNRIESIEMLDYTLQAFPPTLNPDLIRTLDKIRAADKKRSYLPAQKENYRTSEKPKKSVNFEKITGYSRMRNGNDMQIEGSPRGEFNVKKERFSDEKDSVKGRNHQSKIEEGSERRHMRNHKGDGPSSILKTSQSHNYHPAREHMSNEDDSYRRMNEEHYYKRQKINQSQYRSEKSSRTQGSRRIFHEDEEDEENAEEGNNHEEIFVSGESSENEDERENKHSRSAHNSNRVQSHSASQAQKIKGSLNRIKREVKEENEKSVTKFTPGGSQGYKHSQSKTSSNAKSEHKRREEEPRRRGRPRKQNKPEEDDDEDYSDEAYLESEDDDDDDEDEEYEESDSPSLKRKKAKSDRGVHGLHDWINRRVTGYLIFQNTIQDENHEKGGREGDHQNRVTGKKWKKLSKSEKEEYKSLAMNARVDLKKEFKDVDKDDPELGEYQDLVEKKMKKIKKK